MQLPQTQYDVLARLGEQTGPQRVLELAAALGLDQSPVTAACTTLAEAGYVALREATFEEYRLGKDGEPFAAAGARGASSTESAGGAHTSGAVSGAAAALPERVIVGVLRSAGGRCKVTEIPARCSPNTPLNAVQVGQSLRWLGERGWAKKEGDTLVLLDAAQSEPPPQPDELMLRALAGGRVARREELTAEGVDVDAALALLKPRKNFLVIKERADRTVEITAAGGALLAGGARGRKTVTQLTPELLADGSWRNVDLATYDVRLAAKRLYPGKDHPFQRTLDRVRRVFLEMGFAEIKSPYVESSFWDFDALFQPQDHPARDMQDTFYVAKPSHCRMPDDALVERIRAVHENGGDTGSTGWQYRWNRELAHKPVLRTHTTAATIRALAAHPRGQAGKYFVIGPVFRRETVDYKHLPIFHQVDGIIVDAHANLSNLLGTLRAFYHRMGFERVDIRPSFFPYTEPSAEVMVYLEKRGEWVEMGGSGIFRPEVTLPLGVSDRVLAWGLGLERLAMLMHGLSNIGDLYFATMPWLRETPLCR